MIDPKEVERDDWEEVLEDLAKILTGPEIMVSQASITQFLASLKTAFDVPVRDSVPRQLCEEWLRSAGITVEERR
jgi:hypothetical protein